LELSCWKKRFTTRFSGYWNDIHGYQVERNFSPGEYTLVNAEEATSRGVEASAFFEPSDGLRFYSVFGWNDFRFDDYRDPFTGARFDGNRAPFIPRFTLLSGAEYRHETGLFARVETRGLGQTFYSDNNDDLFAQNNYALLDAQIGWENKYGGIYLYGRNLTDEEYFTYIIQDVKAGAVGEPQVVGVKARIRY
jgi:iron complex outermembrane receptor protein